MFAHSHQIELEALTISSFKFLESSTYPKMGIQDPGRLVRP